MSKYTDFYPSTGGEIIAINEYAPFYVGTTSGNPTGYDPATGIYTTPAGTVFIETGQTTSDASYPNANSTGGLVGDSTARTDTDSGQPLFIRIG